MGADVRVESLLFDKEMGEYRSKPPGRLICLLSNRSFLSKINTYILSLKCFFTLSFSVNLKLQIYIELSISSHSFSHEYPFVY